LVIEFGSLHCTFIAAMAQDQALLERIGALETKIQLVEAVGATAVYVTHILMCFRACSHCNARFPCRGVCAMGAALAFLRRSRTARFKHVIAERISLVQPMPGAFSRDALVGELKVRSNANSGSVAEMRLFNGSISLYDRTGKPRIQADAMQIPDSGTEGTPAVIRLHGLDGNTFTLQPSGTSTSIGRSSDEDKPSVAADGEEDHVVNEAAAAAYASVENEAVEPTPKVATLVGKSPNAFVEPQPTQTKASRNSEQLK
jgi:hypothetical protein